jgi:Tfp pilus assembly protein FimT
VVLVIISVIAGFVGPKLAGSLTNMNLKTASKRVASALRYARSQAAAHSITYYATFDMDSGRLLVGPDPKAKREEASEGTDGTDAERLPSYYLLKHYELPREVFIEKSILGNESATSGFFTIGFFSNGGSSGGTVILENIRGHSYRVSVDDITGTVQMGEANV